MPGAAALDRAAGADRHGALHHERVVASSRRARRARAPRARGRRRPSRSAACRRSTNSSRACSSTSPMSVVKCSRSAFFATSSGRPGSWIGTSPRASDSTFSATMSRAQTSWPSSAKQAAVTRPTQPTPMTPIGSRSRSCGAEATREASRAPRRARDGQHLLLGQRLQQRVRDPVDGLGRAPRDQPQAVAVEVQLVLAPADLARLGRRRRGSAGPSRWCPGGRSTRRSRRS